jgi:hypothetical protein
MNETICGECGYRGTCKLPCAACRELIKIQQAQSERDKLAFVRGLARRLGMKDAERCDWMRRLAVKILRKFPELPAAQARIAYVLSWQDKGGEMITFGDCRKVPPVYQAFLPYVFVITFYECNTARLDENRLKILMLHELMHIGFGINKPWKIVRHDVEDFKVLLACFGLEWNSMLDNRDMPDILVDGLEVDLDGWEDEGDGEGAEEGD